MAFFDWFKKNKLIKHTKTEYINKLTGTFTNRAPFENDILRGAIDSIARNFAKLEPKHIIKGGNVKPDERLNYLLAVQPNPLMSSYDFLYKIATHYFLNNNAFILIDRIGKHINGFYPINYLSAEILEDENNNLYVRFNFKNGKQAIFNYADLIHLRRFYNNDEILGDNQNALNPALTLSDTLNEGIINGVKSSAHIRGILKHTGLLNSEALKKRKEEFIQDYLTTNNEGGIINIDTSEEYIPLDQKSYSINTDELKTAQEKIYSYLGINTDIVNSNFDENKFNAFYESIIEPLAIQAGAEFTRKIFTEKEILYNNQIIFSADRIGFTSNNTKINLIKELMPLGILSINQALEVLNLPPIEEGDKRLISLNYIDASKQNDYQIGGAKDERN